MSWLKRSKQDGAARLVGEIVSISNTCAQQAVAGRGSRTQKERDTLWYQVFCEFLFGFLHIASRLAVGMYGQTDRTTRLLAPLGPLVATKHVETHLGHWPAELKRRIEKEFLQNLSDAQKEYATCRTLVGDEPFSRDSVTSLLAFKVAEVVGDPNDVADVLACGALVASAAATANLRRLIEEAAREPEGIKHPSEPPAWEPDA
jgi:hypothetical protein